MPIIDLHCDTISEILARRRRGEICALRENCLHVDARRLAESGYLLQCFALFVDLDACQDPWQELQELYGVYRQELDDCRDLLKEVRCGADLKRCRAEGRTGAMLTVEEGGVCGGSLERLEELNRMGVGMMTLTWNYPNELGAPGQPRRASRIPEQRGSRPEGGSPKGLTEAAPQGGLTDRGREFVRRMEELGMIVDVSHLSDAGFWDVAQMSRKPFVASHSNARAVCPCARNLTDEMIRALALKGGVMGLNFCQYFLTGPASGQESPGAVEALIAHARHIVRVGGIGCLGIGSDFDGIPTNRELPGAEKMGELQEHFRAAGFSSRQIDMMFSENMFNIFEDL